MVRGFERAAFDGKTVQLVKMRFIIKPPLFISLLFLMNSCTDNISDVRLSKTQRLDAIVQRYINQYEIKTAVSVGIYSEGFEYCRNYGLTTLSDSDIKQNSSETLHYVYSITKTMTAAIILSMIDKGLISFDDTVESFFPSLCSDYKINKNYINMDATVYELLSHTSGICDYTENPRLFSDNIFLSNAWDPFLLLNYIEHIRQNRGEFIYSSTNFIILGKIAEKVLEVNLNELFQEYFFKPLNLFHIFLMPQDTIEYSVVSHPHVYPNTTLNLTGDGENPIDCVHFFSPLPLIEVIGKSTWAAGGCVSDAADISRWGYELFSANGDTSLQKIRKMFFESIEKFSCYDEESYGTGCRKIYDQSGKYWFIGSYGRSLGSENLMYYNSDSDTCFVVLTSSNKSSHGKPDIDDLLFLLFDEIINNE